MEAKLSAQSQPTAIATLDRELAAGEQDALNRSRAFPANKEYWIGAADAYRTVRQMMIPTAIQEAASGQ